jgi:hypothetical protein
MRPLLACTRRSERLSRPAWHGFGMIHASGALWAETGRYPRFDGRVAPTCANHSRGVLNLTRDVIATSLRT